MVHAFGDIVGGEVFVFEFGAVVGDEVDNGVVGLVLNFQEQLSECFVDVAFEGKESNPDEVRETIYSSEEVSVA
jgi:hypothetical protein